MRHHLPVHLQLHHPALIALVVGAGACSSPSTAPATSPIASTPASPPAWTVDSHVHLAYWPVGDELVAAGINAVVDLAAPIETLGKPAPTGLRVIAAGPMLTSPGGYPLDSWGRDGYGIGCADIPCVRRVVDELAAHGAGVIKIAADPGGLDLALVPDAIAAAHEHHLRVAVHALGDQAALVAGRDGADVLAHTPVEPLADDTLEAWRGKAVISTLAAFGGSDDAIANLRALRDHGVTVLYGTDLGNSRVAGINETELDLLRRAGLDDAAVTAAMTTGPAAFWGL